MHCCRSVAVTTTQGHRNGPAAGGHAPSFRDYTALTEPLLSCDPTAGNTAVELPEKHHSNQNGAYFFVRPTKKNRHAPKENNGVPQPKSLGPCSWGPAAAAAPCSRVLCCCGVGSMVLELGEEVGWTRYNRRCCEIQGSSCRESGHFSFVCFPFFFNKLLLLVVVGWQFCETPFLPLGLYLPLQSLTRLLDSLPIAVGALLCKQCLSQQRRQRLPPRPRGLQERLRGRCTHASSTGAPPAIMMMRSTHTV